jgi:glutathione peroxidase
MFVWLSIFFTDLYLKLKKLMGSRPEADRSSLYDFELRSLSGEAVKLGKFRGRKLLIVNTASKCAYTGQLGELQKLQDTFPDDLTVLGFPSNDFLWQEPGSNEKIATFCSRNYGVTFPMFEKISVRGRKAHPLYQWLSNKSGKMPAWNFCKYLIDEKGEVIDYFLPKVKPFDTRITQKIRP